MPVRAPLLTFVTFNVSSLSIDLESDQGQKKSIPCSDLAELHRLAGLCLEMSSGYDVTLKWEIPVLQET